VAELCIAALAKESEKKIAFDCITQARDTGGSTSFRTAEEALEAFLKQGIKYNYAI
jgi:hypothetical protein